MISRETEIAMPGGIVWMWLKAKRLCSRKKNVPRAVLPTVVHWQCLPCIINLILSDWKDTRVTNDQKGGINNHIVERVTRNAALTRTVSLHFCFLLCSDPLHFIPLTNLFFLCGRKLECMFLHPLTVLVTRESRLSPTF